MGSSEPVKPHVVLFVIDTLRADIVEEVDTPHLDRLAKEGQKIKKAWAPSTWTAASVISIFSGRSVIDHGWDHRMPKDLPKGESYPPFQVRKTLAEELKSNGYTTVGLYANRLLNRELGFDRGFDVWRYISDEQASAQLSKELSQNKNAPHFVYVHLYGAHQPLRPSLDAQKKWGIEKDDLSSKGGIGLRALQDKSRSSLYHKSYRAVVEDIDANLGRIMDSLSVLSGEKIVIVTSDHGELLGEHDKMGHDAYVYEPLTWVPLVVRGMKPLSDPFSLVDLSFEICQSLSLRCSFQKSTTPIHAQREGDIAILEQGWEKFMYDRCYSLYDDPQEINPKDCSDDMQKNIQELIKLQGDQPSSFPQKKSFSPHRLQQLRSLGYVE